MKKTFDTLSVTGQVMLDDDSKETLYLALREIVTHDIKALGLTAEEISCMMGKCETPDELLNLILSGIRSFMDEMDNRGVTLSIHENNVMQKLALVRAMLELYN